MHPDVVIAEVAAKQYGAFTRKQAYSVGFSARMIDYRVRSGRWEIIHPTVYAHVGSSDGWHRKEIAACFWASGAAAGRAAGFLHGLPGCEEPSIEVVTIRDRKAMPRCGIYVHVTNRLLREQVTVIDSIPTTTVDRTLLDLCGQLPSPRGAIALDNALLRGLTSIGDLDHCLYLTARRGRNGCGVLRSLIKERASLSTYPNSPLETVIFEMIARSPLPVPVLQYSIFDEKGFVGRPDFVYPDQKLIIEGHSKLWHTGKYIEKKDLEKHHRFVALGFRIRYLTWADATLYGGSTVRMIERELEGVDLTAPERAGVWLS